MRPIMPRPREWAGRRFYAIALIAALLLAGILVSLALLPPGKIKQRISSLPPLAENDDGDDAEDAAVGDGASGAVAPVLRSAEVNDVTTSRVVPVTLQSLLRSNSGGARRTGGPMHRGNCRDDLPGCCPRNPKVRPRPPFLAPPFALAHRSSQAGRL